MTAQTPVYGIQYLEVGEPARTTRAALQANAQTIEAALLAGGITPPGASDYAALVGRVNTLETTVALLTDRPRAVLRQTTAQTGLGTGYQLLNFQTEDLDSHNGHSTTTNITRWTCPTGQAGLYLVTGTCTYAASTTAQTALNARVLKNGTAIPGGTGSGGAYGRSDAGGSSTTTGPKLVTLAAGDFVEIQGYANQAAWATAVFADTAATMTVLRVQ